MRLIDVEKITDDEIIKYLGVRYASCLEDIRDMLENQPTLDEKEIIRKAFDRVVERLEEINYNDIQMVVSEVLEKYGFPKESVVQDEIWDALDGLYTSKSAIKIVKEECGINE